MKLDKFGGLNTLIDATNLPVYASPDCSDVEFLPGLVRTRPGTASVFSAIGLNPTVNYLKTYIAPTVADSIRTLALMSFSGRSSLYKENATLSPGVIASVNDNLKPNSYLNSVSLFGREYLASGDGQYGIEVPLQYDDTNLDRVSQVGPGAAPIALDESMSAAIAAPAVGATQPTAQNINSASEVGNIVTIVTAVQLGIAVGQPIIIAGVGVGYNGTWTAITVNNSTNTYTFAVSTSGLTALGVGGTAQLGVSTFGLTTALPLLVGMRVQIAGVTVGGYNGTWTISSLVGPGPTYTTFNVGPSGGTTGPVGGLAASGNGTVTIVGNIVAGIHKVSVVFVTRQGYVTAPAPPSSWTAVGLRRVVLVNIPIGPANVVQRIVIFTAVGGSSFFYSIGDPSIFSSAMIINDNTTTTATFDFSDAVLLSGVSADALFELVELGECSGVTQYSSRLFWLGERNKIQNFLNMSFDGGTVPSSVFPLGWVPDVTNGAGGGTSVYSFFNTGYLISGDGVTATRGLITQTAVTDAFGSPILSPNVNYSVRARIQKNGAAIAGTVHIHLFSASAGINTTGITVAWSAIPSQNSPQEYIAQLTAPLASIPSDLVLRVYSDGTPTAATSVRIDNIEVFSTSRPVNTTIVRASKIEDPESYDGVTGFLDVAPSNGQAVRCAYVRRNNLYFVKDRSLYVTQDDGVNEPNQWTIQEVSQKVGTLSVRGVGFGDEWEIIAGQDGAYYFDGGEPQKISQEIQPTWDSINWALGYLVDVKVDTKRKRIYIAVPLGASATANNRVLTLDYTDGFGDPNPTNTVNIAGVGRKWAPWTIASNSMNLILRSDGTQQLWFGNGTGIVAATGKIYQLDATGAVFSDDGAAINSYWQSGYFQDTSRLTFGPLVANVVGVGTCSLILRKGDQGWVTNLRSWAMSPNGFRNMERMLNIETERLAVRFGTNLAGERFSLQGLALYAREATWAALRGINA